jgi:hypothetical protein
MELRDNRQGSTQFRYTIRRVCMYLILPLAQLSVKGGIVAQLLARHSYCVGKIPGFVGQLHFLCSFSSCTTAREALGRRLPVVPRTQHSANSPRQGEAGPGHRTTDGPSERG